ncbi:hypothetical protein [Paraburkholderia atlantica]|uniref:hypothetical protein n=1 Tax=Paraburkholderia atlantica TaxID=2654982 RepID=UPI0012FBF0C5|nr:hypothetical protein [Paraburkholderia atlantica]
MDTTLHAKICRHVLVRTLFELAAATRFDEQWCWLSCFLSVFALPQMASLKPRAARAIIAVGKTASVKMFWRFSRTTLAGIARKSGQTYRGSLGRTHRLVKISLFVVPCTSANAKRAVYPSMQDLATHE